MCNCSCHEEDYLCEQCCDGHKGYFGGKSLSEAAKRFRKIPVVVEAMRLTTYNMAQVEKWCGGSIKGTMLPPVDRVIDIQTLEGEMRAEIGDWIIKGVQGEFYPCKPDIFALTYEAVQ